MPHGSIAVGGVEVTALCDGVSEALGQLGEIFPDVPEAVWEDAGNRYPGTVGREGLWRLHVHCYLVRSGGSVILLDTGIGPPGTPVAEWFDPPGGALLRELEAAGAGPEDVDLVVTSHVHVDHVGWNVTGKGAEARPTFPRATYLIQEGDWIAYQDEEESTGREARDRSVRALRRLGVLELVRGERELTDEVRILPTPGHTAGSQGLLVDSGGERALLCGDVANHPVQVTDPGWRSVADADPSTAVRTREVLLARAESEAILVSTAHFPEPFGRVVRVEGRRSWAPVAP